VFLVKRLYYDTHTHTHTPQFTLNTLATTPKGWVRKGGKKLNSGRANAHTHTHTQILRHLKLVPIGGGGGGGGGVFLFGVG